jgi:uncharacterized membrane protein
MNMKMLPLLAIAGALSISACANMTPTQQRTLSGAGGGAVAGTVVGAIAGNAGLGAVVGAGVGAAGGYIWDQHKQAEQRSYEQGVADGRAHP